MAVAIVVLLEVIDVDHRERKAALVAPGALDLALERLVEVAVICEPGEPIDLRQPQRVFVFSGIPERHRGVRGNRFEQAEIVRLEGIPVGFVVDVDHAEQHAVAHQRSRNQRRRVVALAVAAAKCGVRLDIFDDQWLPVQRHVTRDALPNLHLGALDDFRGKPLGHHHAQLVVVSEQQDRSDLGVEMLECAIEKALQYPLDGERRTQVLDGLVEDFEVRVASLQIFDGIFAYFRTRPHSENAPHFDTY